MTKKLVLASLAFTCVYNLGSHSFKKGSIQDLVYYGLVILVIVITR